MTALGAGTELRALLLAGWQPRRPELAAAAQALTAELARADARRAAAAARAGVAIPETLAISLTSACDLRCPGCGAAALVDGPVTELGQGLLAEAMTQAVALGIQRFALLGGEPLLSPLCEAVVHDHPRCLFTLLTNGRPLTDARADRLAAAANCLLVVNVGATSAPGPATGLDAGAVAALARVRRAGLLFAVAATVTRLNQELLGRGATLDGLAAAGAGLAIFFAHTPGFDGTAAALSLSAAERRGWVARVRRAAAERGLAALFIPEDEWVLGGCAAAGRLVVHLGVRGTIEPCPFVPYSRLTLRGDGLLGALRSAFFAELRAQAPAWEGRGGCAYRDAGPEFREVCRRHGVALGGARDA